LFEMRESPALQPLQIGRRSMLLVGSYKIVRNDSWMAAPPHRHCTYGYK